ncbi:uncharacterized protein LOC122067415 [Macadamia integrifolia]|uniref:uncharacterized protein LOC122067415 n=1 Tax=Macadamia integrifolia TaxID=60698 RepID=UPI001C500064|nr:uncharacterized protein LOC122067415 [Macadamia integrifolia]
MEERVADDDVILIKGTKPQLQLELSSSLQTMEVLRPMLSHLGMGLDLSRETIHKNLEAGVIEPAMSKGRFYWKHDPGCQRWTWKWRVELPSFNPQDNISYSFAEFVHDLLL